ncbi:MULTISPECIES: hypothetical protein [unclassified Shewanella]|uniref:hypothetical protein n=1 Tax=unclassified Shewanella TaxID=196818 RepID=UPI001BC2BCD6|nr:MULTISPECIES: hypothetical protein [unclassified Shewanella]GIU07628.1 hypothetical protein TUM4444_07350 [Shewanella sp. MBTL60-112-B1]GIU30229.1 hypothetical protein TUM4445_13340 [Shewanella sp. MBTL60-112-B2]
MKSLKFLILLLSALSLSACTSVKLTNLTQEPIPTNSSQSIETAIINGCKAKGWTPVKGENNIIDAYITVRSHKAHVRISYNEHFYNIDYVDSTNLNYNNGEIHRNYNKWVHKLSSSIRQQLNN